MRWFKHDSDAHMDAKMRRLIHRWGFEAYGLYWYCLELIAKDVGTHNLTFELEHDAEILAHDLRMSREKVEEMMRHMVELGLFEASSGRITCLKLFKRIDLSQGGTKAFRDAVLAKRLEVDSHKSHDCIMTKSCIDIEVDIDNKNNSRLSPPVCDEVEPEKTSAKKKDKYIHFEDFWRSYPRKEAKQDARKAWGAIPEPEKLIAIEHLRVRSWPSDRKFIPLPASFIRGARWEDEQASTPAEVSYL